MINLEMLEKLMVDGVNEFNLTHTHTQKIAMVENAAKNNDINFLSFAAFEVFMAVVSLMKAPYNALSTAQKARFVFFESRTMFNDDFGEDLVYWCTQDCYEAKDVLFERVLFAVETTKDYAELRKAYENAQKSK